MKKWTNPYDASGFVFTGSLVHGSEKVFLGRPWRSYARVIFYKTDLTDVVVPQGWDSWHFGGHVSQLTFAEIGCYGSRSNTGRRVSKKCVINVLGATLKPGVAGYITAQGRTNPYDASGFVFTDSLVYGSGKAFLGRPWRSYARVIFYNTDLTDVVVPQGWDSWHFGGHVSQMTFAEIGCYGSRSNTGRRVSWVKKLSGFSVQSLINLDFINSGGWVQALTIPV
ncbi:hypothetical protein Bca52824_040822 [Brassica carinata]|uniref:pectinesterase n=1 Tax=Brassica carinata TaxID=52824 RepID=A0A8X7RVH9_BRACI|nr:hypothetical protein Bca52824_040822 [Brassica carinata]